MGRIIGTLHEEQFTVVIVSRSLLIVMRNCPDKICGENQNTHFVFNDFFPENHALYKIMWKTIVSRTSHRQRWRMRVAFWANRTTNKDTNVM